MLVKPPPAYTVEPLTARARTLPPNGGGPLAFGSHVVAKPVDVKQLFSTLQKWIPTTAVANKTDSETASVIEKQTGTLPENLEGIDLQGAVQRLGGNRKLLYKLLLQFHEDGQSMTDKIRQSLDNNEWYDAQLSSHSMKGVAASIGISNVQKPIDRPLLIQTPDSLFIAIGEAELAAVEEGVLEEA